MVVYFIALLLFILTYAIVKFFIGKVESIKELAEIIALVAGVLVALVYVGALH